MIYHGGPYYRREPIMGYAILRIQKLKSGIAVRRSLKHAFREQETPNADPERTPDNTHIGAADVHAALAKFNERLATQDKVRKNAVLAVEYLVTASPKDMEGKTRQEQDAYFRDALQWVEDKHGKVNVIYAGIHRDEQTPHMYAYVVPLDERGKLNCRAFLGGAKALSEMQTDFAREVGLQHGLQRGIAGSKARHTSIQQYYSRVSKAFEPLPEVKTPVPNLRPEPEKPGMFAARDAKEAYQVDHGSWEREQAAAHIQRQQHMAEVKAQRDKAVETAKRHEMQANEASALKAEVGQLKQSNGVYAKKVAELDGHTRRLLAVAELFTPEEIRAAQARRQQQDAEKAQLAKVASIEAEAAKRVQDIQKLLLRGGAEYTFGMQATMALRKANDNASRVDWKAVEARAVIESMGQHGQSAENVAKAILAHSPARADPVSHAQLWDSIMLNAPELEAKYEHDRVVNATRSGPTR